MSRIARLAALALLILSPAAAHADTLLAGFDYSGQLPYRGGDPPIVPFVSYGDPGDQPAVGYLEGEPLTFIDFVQGNSFVLTGDFANFASLATNGVDNSIYVGFGIQGFASTLSQQFESTLLSNAFLAVPGLGTPDFAGYDITRVVVMGSSYSVGIDTMEVSLNYQVYGDRLVPEPGSWVLLALGACALVGYGRARRQGA